MAIPPAVNKTRIGKTIHPRVTRAIEMNPMLSEMTPRMIAPRSPRSRVVGPVKNAWATAWRRPKPANVSPTIQMFQPNLSSP